MSEQIIIKLKKKLDDLSTYENIDADTRRNTLKEELQFYILNFIYYHPKYNKWIMYGGSALRIIHGLDRMSVDLDFEVSHKITEKFLEELKKEVENYFINIYGADSNFLTIKITTNRGLLLKFHVGEELGLDNPSNQVHVKIDLNHFTTSRIMIEHRPINRDQFSFIILTYNMGALMASKLAAIFLRGTRGVGDAIYEEKGRDIYDLLWYMRKKIIPDFDYMLAKNIDIDNIKTLFDKLTLQMNKVSDNNLKNDLSPLFVDQNFISNWLKNWRETYLRLLENYKIQSIKNLERINIYQDFNTDTFYFTYTFYTDENNLIKIVCRISDYFIDFHEGDLFINIDKKIENKIEFNNWNGQPILSNKLKQYVSLFYQKIEKYFKKTKGIMMGDAIVTKLIRMTADNLNPKEQIVLNRSALLSCELDDLLK